MWFHGQWRRGRGVPGVLSASSAGWAAARSWSGSSYAHLIPESSRRALGRHRLLWRRIGRRPAPGRPRCASGRVKPAATMAALRSGAARPMSAAGTRRLPAVCWYRHKALNRVVGPSDPSGARKIVLFVRSRGRIGRIWRGACSHDVLTERSRFSRSPGLPWATRPRGPGRPSAGPRPLVHLPSAISYSAVQTRPPHNPTAADAEPRFGDDTLPTSRRGGADNLKLAVRLLATPRVLRPRRGGRHCRDVAGQEGAGG